MSRLKRQRLTAAGQDRVTASNDETEGHGHEEQADSEGTKQQQGRSLFVRSLPANATSESLSTYFSQSYPLKHATVVVDPATKKSKGYGFVTFADVEDAQSARKTFNQSLFEGQKIKVAFAEPRQRQAKDDHSTNPVTKNAKPSRQTIEPQPPPKLIVRNLPWTIKEPDQLAAIFRSYGKVKHATLPKKNPGLSAGFGFVVLRGRKNAEKALEEVNGKEIEGRTIAVDWAVEKEIWETLQTGDKESEVETQLAEQIAQNHQDQTVRSEEREEPVAVTTSQNNMSDPETEGSEVNSISNHEDGTADSKFHHSSADDSSTLFIRNLPFSCTDEALLHHFSVFGAVRYARVVFDPATERSKGTGFVCFYKAEDANACLRETPRIQPAMEKGTVADKAANPSSFKPSLLEDTSKDTTGRFTLDGRVLSVSRAVDRKEATRLTHIGGDLRNARDLDRRRLYLLTEGTVPSYSPLYDLLSATEIKMREDSARQRQSLIKSNPTLHLSLTRLSIRTLPRNISSKDLKALAREAVVGFAKDVKHGARKQLSREELARSGEVSKEAEKARKAKGKGIVRQAKVVFESREGSKVAEESGAGRSRGYGFIEYSSHRWALMGLRWLNGHAVEPSKGTAPNPEAPERRKRLIAEFAIENAQVVERRHEREAKARERSKFISEKREKGEITAPVSKSLSKDQLMAKTRKGMKKKDDHDLNQFEQRNAHVAQVATDDTDKFSKRQQIIGRKRMMRKSRNKQGSK